MTQTQIDIASELTEILNIDINPNNIDINNLNLNIICSKLPFYMLYKLANRGYEVDIEPLNTTFIKVKIS